jgi:predicted MFS family arabinose efflux permease
MQAFAVAFCILLATTFPFVRGRVPVNQLRPSRHGFGETKHFRSPTVWLFLVANLFQALGFFIPALYLPSELGFFAFDF